MVASNQVIEQTIKTFLEAAEANKRTAGQDGYLVRLTSAEADDVMITADLHGNRLNYERLLSLADLDQHARRHLIMQEVCHGGPGYPTVEGSDDGCACMSHLLLEDMAQLKVRYGDRFHFLLGNHELAELVDFPIVKSCRMLNLAFRAGLQRMYGDATDRVRQACGEFLSSCPLAVQLDNGLFVCHSAPEGVIEQGFDTSVFRRKWTAEDLQPGGAVFRLLWGRDFSATNAAAFAQLVGARVLIHGHEPCPEGSRVPNEHQIILDCCGLNSSYALVPLGKPLSQEQVRTLIRSL